jgi:hypothetical protein
MDPPRKPGPRHYYDFVPAATHFCGDIWKGLPSGGLLGLQPVTGIVVTPACDLSQRKAETITYLPIIPVRAYFSTLGVLPEVHNRLQGQLRAGGLSIDMPWDDDNFIPPTAEKLNAAERAIADYLAAKQRGAKEIAALSRASSGLRIARAIADPNLSEIPSADLSSLFGNDWADLKVRIAKNSFSTNVHFLPSDEQDQAFSGVPVHSVALFRYPLTTSIEILDRAQQTTDASWQTAIDQTTRFLPAAKNFRDQRPIKALSLRPEFLHDLLSRYVAVYARLGSPDFTKDSIDRICAEMDN